MSISRKRSLVRFLQVVVVIACGFLAAVIEHTTLIF